MPKQKIQDIEIYCEVNGKGAPVVLIHGLGSSTRDWEYQVSALSTRYQVVTFDVRGHGQSSKPPGPYSIPQFASDTIALLKSIGIGSAHIVGLSMGGMIAFQLAVDAPQMVKSLVIVNSAPELIARTLRQKFELAARLAISRFLGMRKMGQVLSKRLFPKPEQEFLRRIFVERWAENDQRAYLDSLRALVGWSVADRLGTIACPTLVISADHDYTPVSFKAAYLAKMPRAELVVISDSRHATPVEQPEKFNAALEKFLNDNEGTRTSAD